MNTFNSAFPTIVSRDLEVNAKPKQLFRQLAMMPSDGEIVNYGDTYSQQRISRGITTQYQRNTNIPNETYQTAGSDLLVDKAPTSSFTLDDLDVKQSKPELSSSMIADTTTDIANHIDREYLFEASIPAASVIDAGTFGGVAGEALSFTGTNVFEVLSRGRTLLATKAQSTYGLNLVLSPFEIETICNQVGARETDFGDSITKDGLMYEGGRSFKYNGSNVYETLNHTVTQVLSLDLLPTNADTLVIQVPAVFDKPATTITLTLVTAIGTTPGNVLIGVDVNASVTNIANFLNNPLTTSATQVGFAADSDEFACLLRFVAEADTTNDDVIMRIKAGEAVVITTNLTDAGSGLLAARRARNLFMACDKATAMVIQKDVKVENERIQSQWGSRWKWCALFGTKTFVEASKKIVRLDILIE